MAWGCVVVLVQDSLQEQVRRKRLSQARPRLLEAGDEMRRSAPDDREWVYERGAGRGGALVVVQVFTSGRE